MDIAETTLAPEDLEKFREARAQHYKTFIVQEWVIDGNVCTETLYEVTRREIDAGRMTSDNRLREIAETGMAAPHLTRAELLEQARKKNTGEKPATGVKGFWHRLRGRE